MMYWAASLLQIFSPLPIRNQIMKLIDPINAQNKALLTVIKQNEGVLGITDFTKDNPNYSEYLKDDISWSTLYVLIDYLKRPEYMNSLEVIEFHKNLNMELNKIKDESQRNMIQHLLQFVGFLPIPIDKPEPAPPHQSFVTNVITTMRQKMKKGNSWTETMSKTVNDAVESAKNAVKKKTAEMSAMATSVVASNAASVASVAASNAASVAPAQKSFFSKMTNAVEGRFKPSAIEQAKEDLELKELQLRIKKINRELAAMNAENKVVSVVPSAAESAVPSAVPSATESVVPSVAESKTESAVPSAAPIAAAESAVAPMPASLPPTPAKLYSPQGRSQLPLVIGQGGGRSTRRTRRLRASKKSPRQRVRE
jgi:hypothetical protein